MRSVLVVNLAMQLALSILALMIVKAFSALKPYFDIAALVLFLLFDAKWMYGVNNFVSHFQMLFI